ncbi:MAG: hypothetical protein QGG09_21490, partial [Pirellulaceae bacterium]|nr:hypothetical protein [Pirellulaceae bacterium]
MQLLVHRWTDAPSSASPLRGLRVVAKNHPQEAVEVAFYREASINDAIDRIDDCIQILQGLLECVFFLAQTYPKTQRRVAIAVFGL